MLFTGIVRLCCPLLRPSVSPCFAKAALWHVEMHHGVAGMWWFLHCGMLAHVCGDGLGRQGRGAKRVPVWAHIHCDVATFACCVLLKCGCALGGAFEGMCAYTTCCHFGTPASVIACTIYCASLQLQQECKV